MIYTQVHILQGKIMAAQVELVQDLDSNVMQLAFVWLHFLLQGFSFSLVAQYFTNFNRVWAFQLLAN